VAFFRAIINAERGRRLDRLLSPRQRPHHAAHVTAHAASVAAKPLNWAARVPGRCADAGAGIVAQVALQNNATALDLAQLLPQRWHAFLR
jgi:hypothetical protein